VSADEDESELDEPQPLSEYDGELRQRLYAIDEDDDDTLGVGLRIGQWVATKMESAVSNQRGQIEEFDSKRLRRWLPWLDQQEWTAGNLLLLEMRS
jgi:hypothetical protein